MCDGIFVAKEDFVKVVDLALDEVPARVEPRFGLVVRRAAIRRFPTRQRVHARAADSTTGTDTDIDQFQETAFFPGTPVAAVHATTDCDWWFVIGPTYDGWVAAVDQLLRDRELRAEMSVRGRAYVEEHYSVDALQAGFVAALRDAAETGA